MDSGDRLYMRFLKATILDVNDCKLGEGFHPENHLEIPLKKSFEDVLEPPLCPSFADDEKLKKVTMTTLLKCFDEVAAHCKSSDKVAISISGGVDSMLCSYFVGEWCKMNRKEM